MKYRIKEIFFTQQGEGKNTGKDFIFAFVARAASCDLVPVNLMQCFGCQAYFHAGCHPPISSEQGECARCQRAAELIQATIRAKFTERYAILPDGLLAATPSWRRTGAAARVGLVTSPTLESPRGVVRMSSMF